MLLDIHIPIQLIKSSTKHRCKPFDNTYETNKISCLIVFDPNDHTGMFLAAAITFVITDISACPAFGAGRFCHKKL